MDEQILKDAQYRKGLSIAFFNATNAAFSLVSTKKYISLEDQLEEAKFIRNYLLEEHKNYYSTVIANIGVNYRAEDTIAKLNNCKSLEELKSCWLSLSEDEHRDGEIIKVKETIKSKYYN